MQARRARRSPGASTDTSDRSSPWDHAIGARIRGCLRRRVIRATRADRRGTPPCRPRRLTTGRRRRRLTTGRRPRQRRTGQVVRVAVSFSWLNDNGWSCRGRAAEGERPDDAPPSECPPGSGSICPATVGHRRIAGPTTARGRCTAKAASNPWRSYFFEERRSTHRRPHLTELHLGRLDYHQAERRKRVVSVVRQFRFQQQGLRIRFRARA